jgi:adenosylhomocysteine nucleosidase
MSRIVRVASLFVLVVVLAAACAQPTTPQAEPTARVVVITATPAPTLPPVPTEAPFRLDNTPRIALISAFGAELEAFRAEAEIEEEVVVNGRTVYLGTLAGHEVLMTESGVSMTNAAMTTQVLLDRFNITHIVFSGIAGGVNPALLVGDVVVPAMWAEYQENFFVRETADGWAPPPWFTPGLTNYGMMFPQSVAAVLPGSGADEETEVTWFEANPSMIAVAQQVAESVELADCTAEAVCLTHVPVIVVGGNGVSGPTFVDNAAYREYAWSTWQADALDMESSAVAHVATVNGIPFVIFRSLSDLAGGGPGENEIGTFFQLAADNSARVMLAFLAAWE